MPPDSPTSLKGHTGTVKRVAWAEPMPLAEVKALGKALGCSVNDVLLSPWPGPSAPT
jgi:diacylglycerol O-acyltransferase